MSLLQKIYFNNKPLLLMTGSLMPKDYPDYTILLGASRSHFLEALKILGQADSKGVVVYEEQKEVLEKELLWTFYPIHSAGGVVLNETGDVLMIFRRGKWDLPKGKQDEGEDIETCAVREVMEETGLKNVVLGNKICNTMHIYPMNNEYVLKYTAWYHMKASAKEQLMAQKEENIEQAMWVKPSEIPVLLHNSFETITEVLQEANIL